MDEPALVKELVSGRIRQVWTSSSTSRTCPPELLKLENVVLTPHLGSATVQTRDAMMRLVVDYILAVTRGDPPHTPVTP